MLGKKLEALGACREAVEWSAQYGDDFQRAWNECHRGDWMLWLAGRLAGEPGSDARRPLVLAACECARLALPYVKEGELRPMRSGLPRARADKLRGTSTTSERKRGQWPPCSMRSYSGSPSRTNGAI